MQNMLAKFQLRRCKFSAAKQFFPTFRGGFEPVNPPPFKYGPVYSLSLQEPDRQTHICEINIRTPLTTTRHHIIRTQHIINFSGIINDKSYCASYYASIMGAWAVP